MRDGHPHDLEAKKSSCRQRAVNIAVCRNWQSLKNISPRNGNDTRSDLTHLQLITTFIFMRKLFSNCFGHGKRCQPEEGQQPLTSFASGSTVIIRGICGGCPFRQKMFAMGLTCGTEAKVLESGGESCTLLVRDAKITLGSGCAEKILAESA